MQIAITIKHYFTYRRNKKPRHEGGATGPEGEVSMSASLQCGPPYETGHAPTEASRDYFARFQTSLYGLPTPVWV